MLFLYILFHSLYKKKINLLLLKKKQSRVFAKNILITNVECNYLLALYLAVVSIDKYYRGDKTFHVCAFVADCFW